MKVLLFEKPERIFKIRPVPAGLLVDLEGTLTEFSPVQDSVANAVLGFDNVAADNGFDMNQVHYVTNANFGGLQTHLPTIAHRIHTRAHKPFFKLPNQLPDRNVVVLGDQYLTDGLLAWRHGFVFGLVRRAGRLPVWPRTMLLVGRAVSCLFFRMAEGHQFPDFKGTPG